MAGQTAVEDLREVLRQEIVERMQIGDLLPNERELAERFGVARNTVRETMIHLEALGLIEKTRRGARVRQPDFDPIFAAFVQHFDHSAATLRNVLDFRRMVETGAAPFAAGGATPELLARMAEANARMGQAMTASEAAGHDFDAAVIDLHLGEGPDGFEVIGRLRPRGVRRIALVTADTRDGLKEQATAAGAELLPKPIKPATLKAFLSS